MAERVEGAWISQTSADCAQFLGFADGKISLRFLCLDGPTKARAEVHEGPYAIAESRLTFEEVAGTCASPLDFESPLISLNDGVLRLVFSDHVDVFEAVNSDDADPGTGSVALGCFEDGRFTPHAVTRFKPE